MTNRPDSNSASNHRPLHPRDEREALSALFDGELPDDAARFALKRLDHDAEWRETCGRWQMIGDALRGEATSAAPPGFAGGVMRMLDAEAQTVMAAAASGSRADSTATASPRRRWIGGAALAASVAMAAVLVVRPGPETSSSTPDSRVASGVTTPMVTPVPSVPPRDMQTPASASGNRGTAASLAMANAPTTTANHRAVHRSSRPATRAARPGATLRNEPAESVTAMAAATPVTVGRPFHPPVDDIVTRPWPRSVLSGDAAGALTVGFGSTSTATPSSLYPFEPRLPENQSIRPPAPEPQR